MDRTTRDAAKATRQNEFVGYLKAAVARGVDNLPGARLLPVDRIDPNPYQPRTRPLDPSAAREMDASIRAHGVLQPIVVRPAGDRYQIVDGEQRWRAAQRAGLTTVPGVERHTSDEDMELLALLANTQRNDLAPLDEANAYQRIMTQRELSLRAMADLVHKSHEHVAQRLRLLDNPDITAAVADGWLTPTVALSVDRVKDSGRRAALLDRNRPEGSPTLADARAARQADELEQPQHAPPVKYLTPTKGDGSVAPLHGSAADPHVPAVKYLTPREDAQKEERDTVLDAPLDVNAAPSAQPGTNEDWVRVHDLQTVILSRTTNGRATREQVRAALWADLETVDKWVVGMADPSGHDPIDTIRPTHVTLTTDHVTVDAAGLLADALHAAGVAVARHTFLPARDDEAHPSGVLLLATDGPPLPLAHLVAPASAPPGVARTLTRALVAARGIEQHSPLATLQLKAAGVFVSLRGRDLLDITTTLDGLPAQLARLDTRQGERRLVYSDGAWRIDP